MKQQPLVRSARIALSLFAALVAILGMSTGAASAATFAVTHTGTNVQGWYVDRDPDTHNTGTLTSTFETGPTGQPVGTGSLEVHITSGGYSKFLISRDDYAGTLLSDISALSYDTYYDSASTGGPSTWYLNLYVDTNGNNVSDQRLDFAPHGIVANTWQHWDLLNDPNWRYATPSGDGHTWDEVKTTLGTNARLAFEPFDGNTVYPSMVFNMGDSAGNYNGIITNIDNIQIGVSGLTDNWDFDPPKSDLTVTKVDSVSNNVDFPNGWDWTVTFNVGGDGPADFPAGSVIYRDDLPAGVAASITGGGGGGPIPGGTGTYTCGVSGDPAVFQCTVVGGNLILYTGWSNQVTLHATPSAPGAYTNPISTGVCAADPGGVIAESDETNNTCSDTVTVHAPDLTISKSNNVSGETVYPAGWTWTLTITNRGNADAVFAGDGDVLEDSLPWSVNFQTSTPSYSSGVTGTAICWFNSVYVQCNAGTGGLTIPPGETLTVDIAVTPPSVGTYTNPIGHCKVDPENRVAESDETLNDCNFDTVVVSNAPVTHHLTVDGAGSGSGNMTATGTINCDWNGSATSGDCDETAVSGTTYTIVAAPAAGSVFTGWGGGCIIGTTSIPNDTCTIMPSVDYTVTASFSVAPTDCTTIANCSFESPSGANLKPDAWKSKGIKTPGDGTDRSVFVDGEQSMRFSNPKARAKRLWQDLLISGPGGTTLDLSFSWRSENVVGRRGLYRVVAVLYYVRGGASKFYVNMPVGTSSSWTEYHLPITAKKAFKKLRVEIDFGKQGAAWFDNFVLTN